MGSTNVEGSLKEIKDQDVQIKVDPQKAFRKEPRSRMDTDQSVFKVYKGVKTFAFSKQRNVIVTGGVSSLDNYECQLTCSQIYFDF